jgi:hypothetical protein
MPGYWLRKSDVAGWTNPIQSVACGVGVLHIVPTYMPLVYEKGQHKYRHANSADTRRFINSADEQWITRNIANWAVSTGRNPPRLTHMWTRAESHQVRSFCSQHDNVLRYEVGVVRCSHVDLLE